MAERFGPYRLEELIGRGGMGEVYRAFDTVKERVVALKRLPLHLATDAEFQARFRRESKVAAQLREAHVIPIHDFGEINGQLFIDMRLVEGMDLAALLALGGPLPPARAVPIVSQIAGALDAAHAEGLVHRDIKPSNTLISSAEHEQDYVYLVDFGISRAGGSTSLTGTGATVGTIDYMAPERFLHGHGDHRVDVYSLACLLYETLTACKPFTGEGLPAQMYAHVHLPPPIPSAQQPAIPPGLDEVVARGMAKDPQQRYQSAGELATAARNALDPATGTPPTPPTHNTTATNERPQSDNAGVQAPRSPDAGSPDTISTSRAENRVFPPSLSAQPPARSRRRRRPVLAVSATLVLVLVVAVAVILTPRGAAPTTPQQPLPAAPPQALSTRPVVATIPIGTSAWGIAVTSDGRRVYVGNVDDDGQVRVIDTSSNTVTATVPVGNRPIAVAVTPDSRHVYVASACCSDTVSVIDTASNTVTSTIPVGGGPGGLAVTPDGRRVYVPNAVNRSRVARPDTVSVIDTASNTVTTSIPVGTSPGAVAITPDGRHAYVVDKFSGTVSVIDTTSNTIAATVPVGGDDPGGLGMGVAVTPDGRHVYVASGILSVIDTTSNTVTTITPSNTVTTSTTIEAHSVAVTPDGRHCIAGGFLIDTTTNTVIATIPGGSAGRVAVTPDGRRAYVASLSDTVDVIDISDR